MKPRERRTHYDFGVGGCTAAVSIGARTSKLTADVTCRRCLYRLWRYSGEISDYDPRLTRAMFEHRVEAWRKVGLL